MNKSRLMILVCIYGCMLKISGATAATLGCASFPLPTTPSGPYSEITWTYNILPLSDPDIISVVVWRVPCPETSDALVLIRITPVSELPHVGDGDITVIQNEIQYSGFLLAQDESGATFNGYLFLPQTFVLGQYSYAAKYNNEDAFTMYWFNSLGNPGLSIPAYDPSAYTDTDGDGILDSIDTDDDNDGMPDTYEIANEFNPLNASDASGDADGDGFSNLAEYKAITDPRDPNSYPRPKPQLKFMPWLPLLLE